VLYENRRQIKLLVLMKYPVKPIYMPGQGLQCTYAFCVTYFLCHSFVPADFMACTISPVVKCKADDLSDIDIKHLIV